MATWHEAGLGGDEEAAAVDTMLQQVHQRPVHRVLPAAAPVGKHNSFQVVPYGQCMSMQWLPQAATSFAATAAAGNCGWQHSPVVAGCVNDIATMGDGLNNGARHLLICLLILLPEVCPCVHALVILVSSRVKTRGCHCAVFTFRRILRIMHALQSVTYAKRAQRDPAGGIDQLRQNTLGV
jgi:hypothetical protein